MKISVAVAYRMSALPIPFGNGKQPEKGSEPRSTERRGGARTESHGGKPEIVKRDTLAVSLFCCAWDSDKRGRARNGVHAVILSACADK